MCVCVCVMKKDEGSLPVLRSQRIYDLEWPINVFGSCVRHMKPVVELRGKDIYQP